MEFGLREVLIGVGLLVIAGILFDGFRRMRRSKISSLDLPSEMGASMDDDWEYYRGELPNGGARSTSLSRQEPEIDETLAIEKSARQEPRFEEDYSPESYVEESIGEDSTMEDVMYADSNDRYDPQVAIRRVVEPDPFQDPQTASTVEDYVSETLSADAEEMTAASDNRDAQSDLFVDDEMLARAKAEQERKLAAHYRGETNPKTTKRSAAKKPEPKQPEPVVEEDDIDLGVKELADVLVINVMAKSGTEIYGEDLYRALTSCGFHHGDMEIFHRYEQHKGQGRLLFSVANVVEPGTFNPKAMGEFTTPGVCMFLKLPGPKRPLQAFDVMVDCARKVSKLIGADMKDENHSVMTQQTFEHYRQRVVDFERKQLSQKALTR